MSEKILRDTISGLTQQIERMTDPKQIAINKKLLKKYQSKLAKARRQEKKIMYWKG